MSACCARVARGGYDAEMLCNSVQLWFPSVSTSGGHSMEVEDGGVERDDEVEEVESDDVGGDEDEREEGDFGGAALEAEAIMAAHEAAEVHERHLDFALLSDYHFPLKPKNAFPNPSQIPPHNNISFIIILPTSYPINIKTFSSSSPFQNRKPQTPETKDKRETKVLPWKE